MFKKCLTFLLAMVLGTMSTTVVAAEMDSHEITATQVSTEDGLVFQVYADHVAVTDYTGSGTEVVIPEQIEGLPVTSIGNHAFYDCGNVTNIMIPECVSSIDEYAFCKCISLKEMTIPEGVTSIAPAVFNGCTSLTKVTLPDTVSEIYWFAFENCSSLTEITIPNSVKMISYWSFYGCSNLTQITIPASVASIGHHAFGMCKNLKDIYFEGDAPMSEEDLDSRMVETFYGVSATAYYPVDNETWTADAMRDFGGKITWEAYVPEVSEDEPKPDIPDEDETVIEGTEGTLEWRIADGVLTIEGTGKIEDYENFTPRRAPWCEYREKITSVVIGDGITGIGEYAFYECYNMVDLHIPDTVTSISRWAFSRCRNLTAVVIPEGITIIAHQVFFGCTNLAKVNLPESLTSIGTEAFRRCSSISDITIPAGVTSLGGHSFAECTSLSEITFVGDAPVFRQEGIFYGVTATARYPADNGTWTPDLMYSYGGTITWEPYDWTEEVSKGVGGECNDSTSWYFEDNILSISSSAAAEDGTAVCNAVPLSEQGWMPDYSNISDTPWYRYRALIKHIVIQDGVEYIGANAFNGMQNAKGVYIGADVSGIGSGSFASCTNVETITFYGDAPAMDDSVFADTAAVVAYPADNSTWNDSALEFFGDQASYAPYEEEPPEVPEPRYNPFADVKRSTFAYDSILWAVENDITAGLTATTFGPNASCNRAQVVTFLWRAAGCPMPTDAENPFEDVKEEDFYYDAVLWAVEKGITAGVDATHFAPTQSCSRAQVVAFLHRAMGSPEISDVDCPFTDVEAGEWYELPVLWAVENGITAGLTPDTFGVNTVCNRAQVVTFLYRTYVN